MALAPNTLFNEILDFLSSTPTPEAILAFRPSIVLQSRASELLEKNRNGNLSDEDRAELDEFQRMNHFMSMLKIRASEKLKQIPKKTDSIDAVPTKNDLFL